MVHLRWLALSVSSPSSLDDDRPVHSLVAGAAILVADDFERPRMVKDDSAARHLPRNNFQVKAVLFNIETVDDVAAGGVKRHLRTSGNLDGRWRTQLAGLGTSVIVPHAGDDVHLVAVATHVAHARLRKL